MLGILTLDTAFPRIPGDVGCAGDVRVPGAACDRPRRARRRSCIGAATRCCRRSSPRRASSPARAARDRDDLRLPGALAADARAGVAGPGADVVAAAAAAGAARRCRGQRVGVVTYSAADLDADALHAAGAAADTPVAGVDPAATSRGRSATAPRRSTASGWRTTRWPPPAGSWRRTRPRRDRARMREHAAVSPTPSPRRPGCRCSTRRNSSPGSTRRCSHGPARMRGAGR